MKAILLPACLLGFAIVSLAQSGIQENARHFTVEHYTNDNGLPQNSVGSIAQDTKGFVWVATQDGLARFDGHRFYTFDRSNLGVASNRFAFMQPSLIADQDGAPKKLRAVSRNKVIYAILPNSDAVRVENGTVVRDSVYYFDKIKSMYPPLKDDMGGTILASGLPNYYSNLIEPERYIIPSGYGDDNYYLAGKGSISYFENGKKRYSIPFLRKTVWKLFMIGRQLFCLDYNGRMICMAKEKQSFKAITGDILFDPLFNSSRRNLKVYWNICSDQAFVFLNGNFYTLDYQQGKFVTGLIFSGFDIPAKSIETVHYDKASRKIFLGSLTQGLFVLTLQSFQTLTIPGSEMENVFYGQLPFGKSAVLTPGGDIIGLDPLTGKTFHTTSPAVLDANKKDKRTMLRDKDSLIWIKQGYDILKFNKVVDRLLGSWQMKGEEIRVMYPGKTGMIWLGLTNRGLYGLNSTDTNGKPELFAKDLTVNYLESSGSNHLLIGTSKGLYCMELSSRKLCMVKGTEGLTIKSIYAASPSEVWITALDAGLMLLRDNRWLVRFPLDRQKFLASSHCVVDDGQGFLWIPTNKGLFQLSSKDLRRFARERIADAGGPTIDAADGSGLFYMYYASDQGFNTNEFNGSCQPCGVSLPDGHISLPSLNGLVWFRPGRVNMNVPAGKLLVNQYQLEGKLHNLRGDTLRLPLDPQQLHMQIATPYFGNSANLIISYALTENTLVHTKTSWLPVNNQEMAIHLGNLTSGTYQLRIRKLNGFGLNNYEQKVITIIIPPHWYEIFWFKTLCLIVLIGVGFLYSRLKVRFLERANLRLETLVGERTGELQYMMEALRRSEKELSRQMHIQSRLVAAISHDVRTPLKFVLSVSKRIKKLLDQQDYTALIRLNDNVEETVSGTYNLLGNLTDYMKTRIYDQQIETEQVNLSKLVSEKILLFRTVIQENNNSVYNEIPADLTVISNGRLLAILIHNLLDNANKYCFNKQIRIFTGTVGRSLHLIIADTGPGMPETIVTWLNTSLAQQSSDHLRELSTQFQGLGLIIVKEISSLLGISLFVEVKDGTMIHLIFADS